MSNHTAAMLLAPAKPKPVQSFHAFGLHYHFTAATASTTAFAICGLLVLLFVLVATQVSKARTRRLERQAR